MANDLYGPSPYLRSVVRPERPAPYEPIQYLLDTLPPVGSCWPQAKRKAWFTAIEALFALTYVESPGQVKEETPDMWWINPTPSQVVLSDRQVEQLITSLSRLDVPTADELRRKFKKLYPNMRMVFDPVPPMEIAVRDTPLDPKRERPKAAVKTTNAPKSAKAKTKKGKS